VARRGGCLADHDGGDANARRCRGDALVRDDVGIAGNDRNRLERNVQLLGDDLRQRRDDAVSDLDAAGEEGHRAVFVDPEPAIELRRQLLLLVGRPLRVDRLLRSGIGDPGRVEGEADDEGADALGEPAAGKGEAHAVTSFPAARLTALMIRVWVPQRQRFAPSAFLMSSSVGSGFWSRRACAVMFMRLMQYPHCAACSSMNACWRAPGLSPSFRPSSVVISASATSAAGVRQERVGWPLTSTVHAPHCARPQPNFGPFSSSWSRSAYRRALFSSTST